MLKTLLCVVVGGVQRCCWVNVLNEAEVKVMLNFRYVVWRERCTFPTFRNLKNFYLIYYAAIIQRVSTIWIILELTIICFHSHKCEVRLIAQQMTEMDLHILFLEVKIIITCIVWCRSRILGRNLHKFIYTTRKTSLWINISISGTILFKFISIFLLYTKRIFLAC